MSKKVQIIADSASDITMDLAKEWDVRIIPLKVAFGETEYLDCYELTQRAFFEKLIETDVLPKTSQATPYECESIFNEYDPEETEIVAIMVSSKLSGCYASAVTGSADKENVYVVDSENAALGMRILVELAVRLRDQGCSAKEIADILDEKKKKIRLIALLDTLEYLKKGGRISPAVAFVGGVLSIKPVIAIENGEVALLGKARGSKNGSNHLTQLIQKEGDVDFDMPICLAYSGLSDHLLKKYVEDHKNLFEDHVAMEELPVMLIGSAIGTHVGPGAIAVTFFVK